MNDEDKEELEAVIRYMYRDIREMKERVDKLIHEVRAGRNQLLDLYKGMVRKVEVIRGDIFQHVKKPRNGDQ